MTVPIFYACDDRFVKYTIVSLSSMIKNASKDRDYHIYVLHTNITEQMQKKLLALQNEQFTVSFENVTGYLESVSERLPIRHYYSKTTYFRLFIAEMFPQYKKAIYIDSDTIVQGDISRLYDVDLGDRYLGACHEQAMLQVDAYGTYVERVVGVSRYAYFNAGVLLINCEQFRRKRILDQFAKALETYNFRVTQDEDYLNMLCRGHVLLLDQFWNTELTEGLEYDYDERDAYVLHYIMANKPWHYHQCRLADVFWQYADETSVADELRADLAAYTDAERERDRISGENLYQMALEETAKADCRRRAALRSRRTVGTALEVAVG